jgi:hypothetical protein
VKNEENISNWERFVKHLEKETGLTVSEIREMCPSDLRKYLEKKYGKKMKLTSLKNELITTEELDKEIDKILKEKT